MKKNALIFVCILFLTACSSIKQTEDAASKVAWDFDHNVQFQQKRLEDGRYYLEVRSNGKTKFSKLATFLLRKSYQLCQTYGFTIEVLEGVEGYYDRVVFKHLLMGSLAANVTCPSSAIEK